MPLKKKGKKIMSAMKKEYGAKKGTSVFYASKNKGTIKGVEGGKRKATASAPVSGKMKKPGKILKSGDKGDRKGTPKPPATRSKRPMSEAAFEKKYGDRAI